MKRQHLTWARSESEARELQALGWRADPKQPITHHHVYSILLSYDGPGDPPMPGSNGPGGNQ